MKKLCLTRVIGMLLGLMMFIQFIGITFIYAEENEQIYVGDFNLYEYRADKYLEEGITCNTMIKHLMTGTMPTEAIVNQLNHKNSFQKKVTDWQAAHWVTSPSEIAEGGMNEIGYYKAIIFSVFKAETSSDLYIWDETKQITSKVNTIFSNMKKWVKESDQVMVDSINKKQALTKIPVQEQIAIKEYLVGEFKEIHPALNLSSTITSDLAAIFNAVDTLEEAVELMQSYIQLSEMSLNMKNVLLEMYNQCPIEKVALKAALYECANAMDNLTAALTETIRNTAGKEVANVSKILINEGWDNLISLDPHLAAFKAGAEIGTCIGDLICNTCFSTDKTIEQYYKMKCLGEFSELLKTTITSIGNTYLNEKSTEHAADYFAAIDALISTRLLSCKFASDYADILYSDAALGWIAISKKDYDGYMSDIKEIEEVYAENDADLRDAYLGELAYDYPEIYNILVGLDEEEEEIISVTGIEFDYEEKVIGLDEYFVGIKRPNVFPANATDQRITYTSSDESILEIDSDGWCVTHKVGTVTITATSNSGNYTDTITVRVVESDDNTETAWDVSAITESGSCGENVEYILYEDGRLVISGNGEMWDEDNHDSPWYDNIEIKEVYIQEGVTSIRNCAFYSCDSLTSISLPEGITSIGYSAFAQCNSLTSILLLEGITNIGNDAFYSCDSLTSISLPEGITSIGKGAFWGCDSLTSISLPKGITSIENNAFNSCDSLTSILLPKGITSIGDSAFYSCDSLTSISLPEGITSIGDRAFEDCDSLTSISLPEGITSIGNYAFGWCDALTSISLPEGITSIGYGAFGHCNSLTSISLPEGITSIEESTFNGCDSLTSISLPEGITSIEARAFSYCNNLKDIYYAGDEASWKQIRIGDDNESLLDATIHYNFDSSAKLITAISLNKTSINLKVGEKLQLTTTITPSDATNQQLIYSSSDTSVATVDNIGLVKAVSEGTATITVKAQDGSEVSASCEISVSANQNFEIDEEGILIGYTGDAKEIVIPDNVVEIGFMAFSENNTLEKVTIQNNVTKLNKYAFYNCSNLKEISIPESVISIGESTFEKCSSLIEITIPSRVTDIENRTFFNCTNLAKVELPDSIISIGDQAFAQCGALTELNIPSGVTSIGDSAFFLCANLTELDIPSGVISIGDSAFDFCTGLLEIEIGDGVTSIGERTFYECNSLARIKIGDGVTSIGDSAFHGCRSLTELEMPSGVTSIGEDAFYDCRSLTIYGYADSYAQQYALENSIPFEIISDSDNTDKPTENPFTDVSDTMYYYQPVLWALENNITAGLTATEFAPEAVCTRGQVVTFLWRAMGQPEPIAAENPFVDVNSNEYYYKAVLWALENGITAGLDATHFAPDATVTRGQFVTFLHRTENTPSHSVSNPFADVPENTYYTNAVLWALENGVTAGLDATHFAPEDYCTRGQVVTFLYRALENGDNE